MIPGVNISLVKWALSQCTCLQLDTVFKILHFSCPTAALAVSVFPNCWPIEQPFGDTIPILK